jgi:hypothetical protein
MNKSTDQQITEHFNQFSWKYWGMLTTRYKTAPEKLDERFQKWIRRLCVTNQAKVQYLYVIEESSSNRPHIHFQLGPMNVSTSKMKSLWVSCRGGIVNEIKPYDPDHGSGYTVKDWLISDQKGVDTRRMKLNTIGATT